MNKLEKLLKNQPLKKPGTNLDEKMDTLFHKEDVPEKRPPLTIRPWQLVAAAMLCIGIGFGLSRITQPAPQLETEAEPEASTEAPYTTIYFIDSDTFDAPPAKQAHDGLFGGKTIEPVITIGAKPIEMPKSKIVVIVNTQNQGELL